MMAFYLISHKGDSKIKLPTLGHILELNFFRKRMKTEGVLHALKSNSVFQFLKNDLEFSADCIKHGSLA